MARRDTAIDFGPVAIGLLVVSVLALLPGALDRWVFPKLLVALAGVLLAALSPSAGRLPRWVWILLGAGAIVAGVAALLGAAPLVQLLGRWPRYEGLVSVGVYVAVAWAAARLLGPRASRSRWDALPVTLALAAIALGVVSVAEAVGLRPIPSDLFRPGALLGNATEQGIVGVMLSAALAGPVLLAWRRPSGWRRWWLTAGVLFALATAATSASRAALVALIVAFAVLAIGMLLRPPTGLRRSRLGITLGGGLAVAGVAFLAIPLTRERLLGLSPASGASTETRLLSWDEALRLIAGRPVLGVGPNGYLDAIPAVHGTTWFAQTGTGSTIDSPHNLVLQLGAAGGIALVLAGIAALVLTVLSGLSLLRATVSSTGAVTTAEAPRVPLDTARGTAALGALAALAGWSAALLTHFTSPGTALLAAVLFGIVVSVAASGPGPWWVERGRVLLLAAWLVLVGVWCAGEVAVGDGVAAASRGEVASAGSAFGTADALRPWDADVASIAAQALAAASSQGSPAGAEAEAWARIALERAPDSVLAAKALAAALLSQGDATGSRDVLVALDGRAPNDPQTLHQLAGALVISGDLAEARTVLERAADLDPTSAPILETLVYVLDQLGDEDAAADAREALAALG